MGKRKSWEARYRKFDGKKFMAESYHLTKSKAQKDGEHRRSRGFHVRVVKEKRHGKNVWRVWTRTRMNWFAYQYPKRRRY